MKLELMNAVILAEDYEKLRDWYIDTLELTVDGEWTENYHYAELVRDGKFVVGIATAEEMKTTPGDRKNATVIAQLNTDDIKGLCERVREKGGDVPFGPSFEKDEKFWFGGFADPEGNLFWVVEMPSKLRN
jgi:predicted enzyme related to lactoylglutathione lyase